MQAASAAGAELGRSLGCMQDRISSAVGAGGADGRAAAADCVSTSAGEQWRGVIDGTAGHGWHLPLDPLNATSLPEPYSPGAARPAVEGSSVSSPGHTSAASAHLLRCTS